MFSQNPIFSFHSLMKKLWEKCKPRSDARDSSIQYGYTLIACERPNFLFKKNQGKVSTFRFGTRHTAADQIRRVFDDGSWTAFNI